MPLNRYVVRVDPQGQTVTVDVLDTSGVSVVTYDSPQFAAASRTLPLVITSQTDFWLHSPGPYDVSCKVGGAEVADAGAPKRVQVSDVPVLVVPDWERQRAATPGGSAAVSHLSVEADPSPSLAVALTDTPVTGFTVDGVDGTGVTLDVDGETFHFTAGIYHLQVEIGLDDGTSVTDFFWRFLSAGTSIFSGSTGAVRAANGPTHWRSATMVRLKDGFTSGVLNIRTVGATDAANYIALDITRMGDIATS